MDVLEVHVAVVTAPLKLGEALPGLRQLGVDARPLRADKGLECLAKRATRSLTASGTPAMAQWPSRPEGPASGTMT